MLLLPVIISTLIHLRFSSSATVGTNPKISTVYYSHQFDKNALCNSLKCDLDELCVVTGEDAMCVTHHALHSIEGVHIDFTSGQPIDHNDEDKVKYKVSKASAKHKHKHFRRHYEHTATSNIECAENELKNVGGRLLQWFQAIHKNSTSNFEMPLHKHKVACRNDVAWMFQQWDGNNDGELSLKELAPLESDVNERCLKAYLDRCDTEFGNDDVITLDEWCDCFTWADDSKHDPPCHAAKHRQDPHLLGAFHPRCSLEGFYKAEQCHENSCWCVDKYGREFDESRVFGRLPDCGQYATEMDDEEERELVAEL